MCKFIFEPFIEKCHAIIAKAEMGSRNILQGTNGFHERSKIANLPLLPVKAQY